VKRKLVAHPRDWPWSSWSHYEQGQNGLISIDSADRQHGTATERQVKTRTLGKQRVRHPGKGKSDIKSTCPPGWNQ